MTARALINAYLFGGQHEAIIELVDKQAADLNRVTEERDSARRLFNRIEAAISHHKKATAGLATEADEALYHARDKVLTDAAPPSSTGPRPSDPQTTSDAAGFRAKEQHRDG